MFSLLSLSGGTIMGLSWNFWLLYEKRNDAWNLRIGCCHVGDWGGVCGYRTASDECVAD